MIVCTHCQAKNSIDSAFCKSCGREVVEADREVARQANAKLIAEGYTLLAEGRTEEAELVARACIEADDKAAGAYSLLGMCYERADDIVAALDCYEKVVDLNPESALDKIKVTQLRNVLHRRVEAEPEPNRKVALAGALACVILVGAIGAITAVLTRPTEAKALAKTQQPNLVADNSQGFGQIPNQIKDVPQGEQYNPQVDPNSQAQGQPQNQAGSQNAGNTYQGNRSTTNFPPIRTNPGGTGQLSNVDPNAEQNTDPGAGFVPAVPDLNIERREEPKPQNPPTGNQTQAPNPDDPKPENQKPIQASKPNGSIQITPSGNKAKTNGAGGASIEDDPKTSGNGLQVLVRTANQQFITGNFDGAARSYEQARRNGGDNGSISKKLAQCYERLGKKGEAIQEYRAAKRQLESKASTDPAAKSQLETVNQALKNLGG